MSEKAFEREFKKIGKRFKSLRHRKENTENLITLEHT